MLDQILGRVRLRIPEVAERPDDLRAAALDAPPVRSLAAAVTSPGMSVIAEIKRRSPSRGQLAPELDPRALASAYQAGGAAAISVLTEPEFFDGSIADLQAAASAVALPVLRKDFILDPVQVWESRAIGADAVLLIVAALDDEMLTKLIATAEEARIETLVEVHDEVEVDRARASGAGIVGVNARDLSTFHVDLSVTERLSDRLGGFSARVAESGITGPADVARMMSAGYDAVLVGETLVRETDPAAAVARLVAREGRETSLPKEQSGCDLGQGVRCHGPTDRRGRAACWCRRHWARPRRVAAAGQHRPGEEDRRWYRRSQDPGHG